MKRLLSELLQLLSSAVRPLFAQLVYSIKAQLAKTALSIVHEFQTKIDEEISKIIVSLSNIAGESKK